MPDQVTIDREKLIKATAEEVARSLSVDLGKGLKEDEARRRLSQFGPNEFQEEKRNPAKDFVEKFWNPIAWILETAAVLSYFLGPNGSGKTTFLQIISTVLKPSSGTAKVFGFDIIKNPLKVRECVGISFQDPRGFWRHKVNEILSFHASIYGKKDRKLIEETLKEFDLWESRNKMFLQLSGGQAKRLEVAKVFIQKPKLAIFDEPTTMIDLDGKRMIWDKIKELKDEGATIIVSTNDVREAEYLADRITIIHKGKVKITSHLQSLKDSIVKGDVIDIELQTPINLRVFEELRKTIISGEISFSEGKLRIRVNKSEEWLPIIMGKINVLGAKVSSIKVTEPSLDDVFIYYTRDVNEGVN